MTRSRILLLLPTFAAGLAVGLSVPALNGSAGTKVTNLLTAALSTEFTPGREVLIDLVEIPPNQKLDWHWHPGEEFHYYLEGDAVVERIDAPPIIGKPGTVGHVAFKAAAPSRGRGNGGEDPGVSRPHQGRALALSGREAGASRQERVAQGSSQPVVADGCYAAAYERQRTRSSFTWSLADEARCWTDRGGAIPLTVEGCA